MVVVPYNFAPYGATSHPTPGHMGAMASHLASMTMVVSDSAVPEVMNDGADIEHLVTRWGNKTYEYAY